MNDIRYSTMAQNPFDGCLSLCNAREDEQEDDPFLEASLLSTTAPTFFPDEPPEAEVAAQVGDHPTPGDIDSLLAREMASMSLKERQLAEAEVHGMADNKERPGLLQQCVEEMELSLEELKGGTAYEVAEAMDPQYVKSPKLRIMFIRADRWNTWEASERMIRFFELKLELFGTGKLCKDITLEDLDADDMESLRSGHHQLSPHKDSAGRVILVGLLALRKFKTVEALVSNQCSWRMIQVPLHSQCTDYFSSFELPFTCTWRPWRVMTNPNAKALH